MSVLKSYRLRSCSASIGLVDGTFQRGATYVLAMVYFAEYLPNCVLLGQGSFYFHQVLNFTSVLHVGYSSCDFTYGNVRRNGFAQTSEHIESPGLGETSSVALPSLLVVFNPRLNCVSFTQAAHLGRRCPNRIRATNIKINGSVCPNSKHDYRACSRLPDRNG